MKGHTLAGKRILVTGSGGFLGRHTVRALGKRTCRKLILPRSSQCDLTREEHVRRLVQETQPEIVIHLAANAGGLGALRQKPGAAFYDNLVMGALLMEWGRRTGVKKFVGIGSVCSYPKHTPLPFREETLWDGYPEEVTAPYGLAKKMMLVQGQAYHQQYGFNAIHLLCGNLYGPGDHFDPARSQVIPALIRRCLEAQDHGDQELVVWGDGTPTREFLYVEDCAEALLLAAERYDEPNPVNIGSGQETSIRDLTGMIVELCGFQGRIVWDPSKPSGPPRRGLDTSKALDLFGFQAKTGLREGLERTVQWYKENRHGLGSILEKSS